MIMLLLILNLAQLWRDTNSHAANARGVKEFANKKYTQSVKDFRDADTIAPSPQRAFNLGTAQIAAGNREQGSATLAKAMNDAHLRADSLFNRGSSALASNAYDSAIRDFTEALKVQPKDQASKRNLEIAILRKMQQQKQQSGSRQQQKGSSPQPQQQQAQPTADQQQQNGDANAEALLRSVQQQEQEELQRMHRARGEKLHVGW
jgi:Ca-activated chloride channel family protein